ncbi:ylmG homolog protein 2, chloroplastic [Dioscorea cayenensis subsp. rotundata]|uniref:YlmG homolog protein 2, chloroplastic n=1 Tax=Dioscorea cayennensis subsp. rotundata TaxID=55577 RepID=A0AB40D2K9_DIOCR|nr:ylmG homolog protein 2, chloroplastic [Dioscorea cayenensis subsp. rotundata]
MAGSSEPPRSGSNGAGAGGGAPCDCLRSGPPRQSLLPILQRTVPTLVSAAERCALAVAEHPLIKPLLSFQSESRRFFQVHLRSLRMQNSIATHNFAAILPGDSVAGLVVANGITNFLNIYNSLLIVRLVLTWFPNSPPAIVAPLSTICDPYLNIFRGIIPPLGGTLDLSPILAFLVLNAFESTAAALPAELPAATESKQGVSSSPAMPFNPTSAQKMWIKRVSCKRSKNSENV